MPLSLVGKSGVVFVLAVAASTAATLTVGEMFQVVVALELAQFPILMSNHTRSRGNARLLDERKGEQDG